MAINGIKKKAGANVTVYLMGDKNTIVEKTKTNALGNFFFSQIIPNQSYYITYDSASLEPNYVMNLYTIKDKFISKLDSVSNKKFIYKMLSTSTSTFNDLVVDDSELKMTVKGKLCAENKNNPLQNLKLFLLNDRNEKIDSTLTDKNGDFYFIDSPYSKEFNVMAENKLNVLTPVSNILIFDATNNLVKAVALSKNKSFNYKFLSAEQSKLSDIYAEDPWLSIITNSNSSKRKIGSTQTIVENILFEFNKAELLAQSQLTLDKIVLAMLSNQNFNIELSAHSDSKGGDAYNLKLSELRAITSKNYIVSKGVNAARIKAKGFGESKLLNNCGNNAICSDDEHAVNRRLEFILIFN
jgi:outer membrane protein OmpA-like peptidoglycan-associated protein